MTDDEAMEMALAEARAAAAAGEAPIGAVLLDAAGAVLATGRNAPIATHDPTAHAEVVALRAACAALGNYRLPAGTTLVVSLEPCAMCAGAISTARVGRLVYGASDPKGGAVAHGPRLFEQPTCHWRPEVAGGLRADDSAEMLRAFFRARR
ncbi:MAG: nucleoside deaminase [Alphaproteobacteria bacterium]|nr:nucleoside deaminase [Alphaproteobacteria bacterium]